jgi:hypothetical protein
MEEDFLALMKKTKDKGTVGCIEFYQVIIDGIAGK